MTNKIIEFLIMLDLVMVLKSTGFGLESTIGSLSITPNLSPGLSYGYKNRALTLNSSTLMIPDTQFIQNYSVGNQAGLRRD